MNPRIGGSVEFAGRRRKAWEFAAVADLLYDEASDTVEGVDAYVVLAVNAGIAAADAICSARLGHYNVGENHRDAVRLLRKADGPDAALSRLLGMKSKSAYDFEGISTKQLRVAKTALETLLAALDKVEPPRH